MLVDSLLWRGFKASGCPRKLNFYGQSNSSHVSALWITVVPRKGWNVGRSIRERACVRFYATEDARGKILSRLPTTECLLRFLHPLLLLLLFRSPRSMSRTVLRSLMPVIVTEICKWDLFLSLSRGFCLFRCFFQGIADGIFGRLYDIEAREILWNILEGLGESRLIIFYN